LLRDSWRLLRKDAALGVDRVSAAEYEANLEENIHQLVERLKLEERLRKFELELAAEKTRVLPFSRYRRGETSFDFLGFEFRWGTDPGLWRLCFRFHKSKSSEEFGRHRRCGSTASADSYSPFHSRTSSYSDSRCALPARRTARPTTFFLLINKHKQIRLRAIRSPFSTC
jgi:hypothetical protein